MQVKCFRWVYLQKIKRLEGISALTYNMIPPPLESRSNLKGVLNPSIKKFPFGKPSSILVSEIIKKKSSILPLTCVAKNSNVFLIVYELFLRDGWPTKRAYSFFQQGALSDILAISNLQQAASRIWTCAEPEFRLS